jgi:hypothetical protein
MHHFLLKHCDADSIVCDLTLGNGNDALFCLQHFKHVYAFDIQPIAIVRSSLKCEEYPNKHFYCLDHAQLDKVLNIQVDIVLMNNGYLPNSETNIMTELNSSITAMDKSLELLKVNGYLCVTLYRKHEGGLVEYHGIMDYLNQNKKLQIIQSYTYDNDDLAPVLTIFQKVNEST